MGIWAYQAGHVIGRFEADVAGVSICIRVKVEEHTKSCSRVEARMRE